VPALRVDDLIAAVWDRATPRRPGGVTNGFAKRARQRGVTIAEACASPDRARGDRVRASRPPTARVGTARINRGTVAATVGRLAGVEIAVHPRRRHIFYTEPFPQIQGPSRSPRTARAASTSARAGAGAAEPGRRRDIAPTSSAGGPRQDRGGGDEGRRSRAHPRAGDDRRGWAACARSRPRPRHHRLAPASPASSSRGFAPWLPALAPTGRHVAD